MASPQYAVGEELDSDKWFVIPQSVVVPPETLYYAVDQKEVEGARRYVGMHANEPVRKDHQVAFQIHRWLENAAPPDKLRSYTPVGEWVVAERIVVNRGDFIGRIVRVEFPIWRDTLETFIIPITASANGRQRFLAARR